MEVFDTGEECTSRNWRSLFSADLPLCAACGLLQCCFFYITGQIFSCSATIEPQKKKKPKPPNKASECITRQHLGSLVKLGKCFQNSYITWPYKVSGLREMTAGNLTNLWKDGSPGFVLVLSLNPEKSSLLRWCNAISSKGPGVCVHTCIVTRLVNETSADPQRYLLDAMAGQYT